MKKQIILSLLIGIGTAVFAVQLPTGQNTPANNVKTEDGKIISAVLPSSEIFETSVGNLTSSKNKEVEFYKNGALKKIHAEENLSFKTSGLVLKLKSPYEFHESGELKGANIAYVPETIIIQTSAGALEAIKNAKITFFKDGRAESFYVSQHNKELPFNLKGGYKDVSLISFYESGNVKQLTPNFSNLYKPLGIQLKANAEIEFYDSKRVKSFIPADDAVLKTDSASFKFVNSEKCELFESGMIKRCVFNCSYSNFSMGGKLFAYGLMADYLKITDQNANAIFEMYEDGSLKKVESLKVGSYLEEFPVVVQEGEKIIAAKSVQYTEKGKTFQIRFFEPALVAAEYADEPRGWKGSLEIINANFFSNVNSRTDSTYYRIWKCFYPENSEEFYMIGTEIDEEDSDYFYTKTTTGIMTVKNNKVTEVKSVDNINADSELIFDDAGKIKSCELNDKSESIYNSRY